VEFVSFGLWRESSQILASRNDNMVLFLPRGRRPHEVLVFWAQDGLISVGLYMMSQTWLFYEQKHIHSSSISKVIRCFGDCSESQPARNTIIPYQQANRLVLSVNLLPVSSSSLYLHSYLRGYPSKIGILIQKVFEVSRTCPCLP
jgi:hypothetical protein